MYYGMRRSPWPPLVLKTEHECSPAEPLELRLDLWNHSPTGFEWGYGGSGPAQLALAILADATEDASLAIRLHQDFKAEVVSKLNSQVWALSRGWVLLWVCQKAEDLLADVVDLREEADHG